MIEQQAKSTPHDVLIAQILDYRTPKNEMEWAANFELHKLKAENEVMKWGLQSLQKLLNIFATITPEDHRHFELILKGILAKSLREQTTSAEETPQAIDPDMKKGPQE